MISVGECFRLLVSDPQDDRERGADSSHGAAQRGSEADSGLSASKVTRLFSPVGF